MFPKRKGANYNDEKLKLEIFQLSLPWYKKLEFWKVLIPTIAVVTSLYFTFGRGILDLKKEKLSIQKEQLKLEIQQFEIKKNKLIDEITINQNTISIKEKELLSLMKSVDSLNRINIFYKNKVLNAKKELINLSKERKIDNNFFSNKLKTLEKIKKEYNNEIDSLKIGTLNLEKNIEILKTEIELFRMKTELDSYEKSKLKFKIIDIENKYHNKAYEMYLKEIEIINKNAEKEKRESDTLSIDYLYRNIKYNLQKLE